MEEAPRMISGKWNASCASVSFEGENEPMLSIYLNLDNEYTSYMFFKN